jgi:type I restriction enzyme S subunit
VGRYLWHWLGYTAPALAARAKGATFKQVNREDIAQLIIDLPPVREQQRIAAILDKADALRAKRSQAIAQLDTLSQSIFFDMFGDLVLNDRGWASAIVSDFVAGFESGRNIVGDDEDDVNPAYRVLKVSAVTSLEYMPHQSKALPPDYQPSKSHFVRQGDLLFSRANTSGLIGATAYVEQTPSNVLLPDKIWRFVWHKEAKADPHFGRYLFRQQRFRSELSKRATGTSGSMKNISREKVLSIPVGLPSFELQRKFGSRAKSLAEIKSKGKASLVEMDALFASLQQHAFRGEL